MFYPERERLMLSHLAGVSMATPAQLQAVTGASIATVRRDLNEMQARGLVKRSHGCVQLAAAAPRPEPSVPAHLDEKARIAVAAASMVNDGDTIFLSSGTTCTQLARQLPGKKDLRIMTINLDVMDVLRDLIVNDGATVSILGGEIKVEDGYVETLDEYTLELLRRLYFDKVFVTVNGIDFEYGYSIMKQLQYSLFQHLLDNSKDFFCLADSSKFEVRTYMHFCPITAIRSVITTREVKARYAAQFAERGIRVITD